MACAVLRHFRRRLVCTRFLQIGMYICKNLGYVLNVAIVFTVSVVLWYLFGMNCIY